MGIGRTEKSGIGNKDEVGVRGRCLMARGRERMGEGISSEER